MKPSLRGKGLTKYGLAKINNNTGEMGGGKTNIFVN